jgi:hypothetical protein
MSLGVYSEMCSILCCRCKTVHERGARAAQIEHRGIVSHVPSLFYATEKEQIMFCGGRYRSETRETQQAATIQNRDAHQIFNLQIFNVYCEKKGYSIDQVKCDLSR